MHYWNRKELINFIDDIYSSIDLNWANTFIQRSSRIKTIDQVIHIFPYSINKSPSELCHPMEQYWISFHKFQDLLLISTLFLLIKR